MARLCELTTPLGPDVLLFRAMRGHEELGRSSEFDLSALSTRGDINPGDLLGKGVTVKVSLREGGYRYFNLYVVRFAQGTGLVGRYHEYHLGLRSWPWFLTRTTDCRIFQEKTVPVIVKEVFADHAAIAVFEDALTGSYSPREYCVQYRETDFDFVSRLLEEEGIYYYFEHQEGRHTLKLVDAYSGHKALAHRATIPYYPPGREIHADEEYVHGWSCAREIQPGMAALRDYDFTKPKADLAVKANRPEKHALADYEWFDFPGEYRETGDGEHYVRARIDEFHAQFEQAEAACNVREIAVGRLFSLTNAPRRDQEVEYLIVGADYDLRDNAYETSPTEGAEFSCRLTALPSRQQFRPARITLRPAVKGPQTAVVVGPGGEEIWCDKYGRVKVQFHWDRYGKKNENSSCWIRVSHPWAGGTWGAVAIPRIGQEVIVDFLEGDPDQPIITGRVYNADQMPPYALPANKTQTGIKSRSSLGASAANFNEIRFEDKKGDEQLFIHAEKNQDIEVENDETHWVGHDRTKTIDRDETTHIKHDRTETVDNNETIGIGGNRSITVAKSETATVALQRTHSVGINETITVGAAQEITVGGLQAISVGAAQLITVGASQTISAVASQTLNAGRHQAINVGENQTVSIGKNGSVTIGEDENHIVSGKRQSSVGKDDTLNVDKNLFFTAGESVTITTGDASIMMKKDGSITIKGKNITIEGSGKINVKASSDIVMKGSKIVQN